jgi:uncharacterized protein (DUF1330 family)
VVHGVLPEVLEGEWPGFLVVIGFPDLAAAHAWYDSPAYREILPLRTRNSDGVTLIVDGPYPRIVDTGWSIKRRAAA